MWKIYLISFIIPLIFSSYVYDSSSVIDYISKPVLDEYTYRVLKRSFALVFEDAYDYHEIATNPPQPYFANYPRHPLRPHHTRDYHYMEFPQLATSSYPCHYYYRHTYPWRSSFS